MKFTHHRAVGFGYLTLASVALVFGTLLSLVMRIHLAWPAYVFAGHGPILPEEYLALVTLHGTLMLFFVMTVAPLSGFGNFILPAQIGATRMSFPRLNFLSLFLTGLALATLCAAPFVSGGSPISGWTAYPPFSLSALAGPGQGAGMDCWLASIAIFSIATTLGSINMLVTIARERADGMTWSRLPLTVWSWLTASLLAILAFSVLLAALVLMFCDRHLHTGFFLPANDLINGVIVPHAGNGSPLLWLHLFWFFGHPEVYIAILPGMGLTSMVLANFARRPLFAYRIMIAATLLIGLLGIVVWGHHMFVAGLNPFAGTAFAASSIAIAIPSSAKVLSWLATVWRSRPQLATPMLFALGFVSLFILGGLSGPILAQPILDQYLHNTFFVVAHFHLVMAMAGMFGLFCAVYYWFPLMFGTQLRESLGRWHFGLTLFFAWNTFLPMHLTGLSAEPRHYAQLTGMPGPAAALLAATAALQRHISTSAICLAISQVLFLINLLVTLRRRVPCAPNPWDATTMEWAPEEGMQIHRGPCDYTGIASIPQWAPVPSGEVER